MSSALACLGLAASDDDEFNVLLKHALTGIREIGTFGGVYVGRWEDDSGAALTLGLHDGQVADCTFGYAGTSGALLTNCRLIHEAIAWAQVTDTAGQQVTAMAFEAEQYRQLAALGRWVAGAARITAFGLDVTVYPDPEALPPLRPARFTSHPGSRRRLRRTGTGPGRPGWPPSPSPPTPGSLTALTCSRGPGCPAPSEAPPAVSAGSPGRRSPSPPSAPPDSRPACAWPPATIRTCPALAPSSPASSSCPPPSTLPT